MPEAEVSRRGFVFGGLAALGVASAAAALSGCGDDAANGGGSKRNLTVGAAHTIITIPESKYPLSEKGTQAGDSGAGHSDGEYDMLHEGHDLRLGLVLIDDGDTRYAIIDIDHVNL